MDQKEDSELKPDSSPDRYVYVSWEGGHLERLMEQWSREALDYHERHTKAERKFRCLHYTFTIPIVLLSTLSGTANIGMNTIFPSYAVSYAQLVLGGIGIAVGMMGTLQNFFKYEKLCEAHRQAAAQWYRYHRNIKTVLALDRSTRRNVSEFFRSAKAEMDRLTDSSPNLVGDGHDDIPIREVEMAAIKEEK